jgi:hypothetical protein
MEKSVADVNLFYWPSGRDNKGENGLDGNRFDNRAVSFPVINSFLLMEGVGITRVQVPFFKRAWNSSAIASRHTTCWTTEV